MNFTEENKKITGFHLYLIIEIERMIKKSLNYLLRGTSISFNIKHILSSKHIKYIQTFYYHKGWIIEKEDEGCIDSAFYTILRIKKKYEVSKKISRFEIMDI
ncbi:MAG TPA: hypothetical protein VMZ91_06425 [Candidatus Paceibacterota bacterium]|nr:hypothetical protein [Candidatus Paceibacterota bacterium]